MSGTVTDEKKEKMVSMLVSEHFSGEASLQLIVWLRGNEPQDEIRLLHIDECTIPSPDEVQSFRFAPTPDVPYAVRLAQVTPDEWDRICSKNLNLPCGWILDSSKREYPRQAEES